MSKKINLMFVFVLLTASWGMAQNPAEKSEIGIAQILHSDLLNEDRNVHIFLPEGYSSSAAEYPVLYMLYSVPSDYHYYTGIVSGLSRIRLIPRMITVAVDLGERLPAEIAHRLGAMERR